MALQEIHEGLYFKDIDFEPLDLNEPQLRVQLKSDSFRVISDFSQIESDLYIMRENYLHSDVTDEQIKTDVTAYFAICWPAYKVHNVSIDPAFDGNLNFTVEIAEADTNITKEFAVDDFDIDFTVSVDDVNRFGVFFKEWAEAADMAVETDEQWIKPDIHQTADDILFAAISHE